MKSFHILFLALLVVLAILQVDAGKDKGGQGGNGGKKSKDKKDKSKGGKPKDPEYELSSTLSLDFDETLSTELINEKPKKSKDKKSKSRGKKDKKSKSKDKKSKGKKKKKKDGDYWSTTLLSSAEFDSSTTDSELLSTQIGKPASSLEFAAPNAKVNDGNNADNNDLIIHHNNPVGEQSEVEWLGMAVGAIGVFVFVGCMFAIYRVWNRRQYFAKYNNVAAEEEEPSQSQSQLQLEHPLTDIHINNDSAVHA